MTGDCEPHDTRDCYEAHFFIDNTHKPQTAKDYRFWLVYHILSPFAWEMWEKCKDKISVEQFMNDHRRSGWNDEGMLVRMDGGYIEFTLRKYDGTGGKRRGVTIVVPKNPNGTDRIWPIVSEFTRYLDRITKGGRISYDSADNFKIKEPLPFEIT